LKLGGLATSLAWDMMSEPLVYLLNFCPSLDMTKINKDVAKLERDIKRLFPQMYIAILYTFFSSMTQQWKHIRARVTTNANLYRCTTCTVESAQVSILRDHKSGALSLCTNFACTVTHHSFAIAKLISFFIVLRNQNQLKTKRTRIT